MKTGIGSRVAQALKSPQALIFLLALSASGSANSAPAPTEPADAVIDLPAGLACAGFDLRIEIWSANRVPKEFKDKNGNIVRVLTAGRSDILAFTNLSNLRTYVINGAGSVQHTTVNADGTLTVANTGHNAIVFFPTDIPAGPSTTHYIGKIVYTVDSAFNFTLQSTAGRKIDICAAIS